VTGLKGQGRGGDFCQTEAALWNMASSGPPDIGSAQAGTAAGENAQPLDAQPLDAQLVAMADHSSGIRGNVLNTKTRLWSEVANRFNQQGIDAAVMIPKFLLLMVAFTFVMMITGTLDAVLEEVRMRRTAHVLCSLGLLLLLGSAAALI